MHELLGATPTAFRPSIPHLVSLQTALFTRSVYALWAMDLSGKVGDIVRDTLKDFERPTQPPKVIV